MNQMFTCSEGHPILPGKFALVHQLLNVIVPVHATVVPTWTTGDARRYTIQYTLEDVEILHLSLGLVDAGIVRHNY
jgi:hypothetical protein